MNQMRVEVGIPQLEIILVDVVSPENGNENDINCKLSSSKIREFIAKQHTG